MTDDSTLITETKINADGSTKVSVLLLTSDQMSNTTTTTYTTADGHVHNDVTTHINTFTCPDDTTPGDSNLDDDDFDMPDI